MFYNSPTQMNPASPFFYSIFMICIAEYYTIGVRLPDWFYSKLEDEENQ